MINPQIAKILYEISILLDMEEVTFKPRAFEKAAQTIGDLNEDLEQIYKNKGVTGLMEIPSIGQGIAKKIVEYINTGKIKEYERLKKKFPVNIEELKKVEGIGPKAIKQLYKELKITNLIQLKKAVSDGKLRTLTGWGEKKEQNILQGLEFITKGSGKFPLGSVLPLITELRNRLMKIKEAKKVVIAGSIRRWKETVGDADILIVSDNPKPIIDYFTSLPEIGKVYGKGNTKSTIKLKNGMDVDLRIVSEKSYGAALNYFTGSKEHNVELRRIAKQKGLKLSEYGLFKKNKFIAGRTEEELYKALGLRYIEPELRDSNIEEIKASFSNKLPNLIKYNDLNGDLQIQTNWSDGSNSIKEMALAAKSLGLKYILITDHTKSLRVANGLDEKRLKKQSIEIDKINNELKGIKIFKGAEVNILKDGSLDVSNTVLKELDLVGIAVHSNFNMSEQEMTQRILKALGNEHSDILFHPTGRLILKRESYKVNINTIIEKVKEQNKILEIDAFPDRLDLNDENIRKAVSRKIKLSIDSDAHNIKHLDYLKYGIAQARRGWASKTDIINTMNLNEFQKFVDKRR